MARFLEFFGAEFLACMKAQISSVSNTITSHLMAEMTGDRTSISLYATVELFPLFDIFSDVFVMMSRCNEIFERFKFAGLEQDRHRNTSLF